MTLKKDFWESSKDIADGLQHVAKKLENITEVLKSYADDLVKQEEGQMALIEELVKDFPSKAVTAFAERADEVRRRIYNKPPQ